MVGSPSGTRPFLHSKCGPPRTVREHARGADSLGRMRKRGGTVLVLVAIGVLAGVLSGLFDENKAETKHPIENLDDIYLHAAAIREATQRFAS